MKRSFLFLAGTIMFLSACTEDMESPSSNELREVIASAENFIPEADSRAFSFVNNEVAFSWANGDTIGIFPNEGAQAYFPIIVGNEESNSASFTGGGWALKASSTYASYYPFIGDFYMDQKEIPVSYVGQKQSGNASMAHLNPFDYMTASASTPTSGRVNFNFKHLGAFVQLKITMPQGGALSSVTLSADEAVFVTEGVVDLTAKTPAIQSVTKSKTLTLDVEGVTTTAENPVASLYMMLAPVDMTNKTLKAIVKQSDGSTETITLTSKNFEKGKAYGVSGTMKDPNSGATAGNGVVSIAKAGTMKKLLGDDYLNITSLKVVGPINGDDVYYLRKMLGGDNFSEAEWGKLTTLDLSEATIVEGGEWYYKLYNDDKFYTANNAIGERMFQFCANLQNIILPENVTSIGEKAFSDCSSLTSVTIGNGVTSIGDYAFSDCSSLISVTIPDNVTSIGKRAFFSCSSLTSVTIGDGFTSIGDYAFSYCDALTSITIPDNVTYIGNSAFFSCSSLTSVTIGNYCVTSIGDNAFSHCSSLTSVTIGNYVTSIGDYAFSDCSSLISVTIPDNVTSIGNRVFSRCSSLISVTIGNSVTSIGDYAFFSCSSLTSVTIPDNVTSIGDYAFSSCSSLRSVYCYAKTPPSLYYHDNTGSFAFISSIATLYVPARCGSKYRDSNWDNFFYKIIEMD